MQKQLTIPLVNTLLISFFLSIIYYILIEYLLLVVATGIEPIL